MRILILHNIRSAENIGSMFRTADAFGVNKIILSGYSAGPIDRFGRPEQKVLKSALGAEQSVPWERVTDIEKYIAELKVQGTHVVALEQDKRSVPLASYVCPPNIALLVGTEVSGVEPQLLAFADSIVEIPMQGAKESLNVSVATGIALFHLTLQTSVV